MRLVQVFKGDNIDMFLICRVAGLVENFNIGIFSKTMNVINVRLCMMVLHIGLYLLIILSMTLTLFQGHSSVKQFELKISCSYLISENFVGLLSTQNRS